MYKMPEVTNFKKRDNTYCCVPLCKSRGSKNPDLSFHLFPSEKKELDRRKKWILALRIGRPVTSRMSVCSRHFVHSDYVLPPHYERKRPRLRKHAIPSLNLPAQDGCGVKPKKRPTTIIIKKEHTEAEEDKSEENVEQEELEIEVNVESERDYFGTDYNSESERGYFGADYYTSDSERDCYETDDNIEFEREYFKTEGNIESQRDNLVTTDVINSEIDCLRTGDNTESERDYLEREDDIESECDYLEIENYLEIESNIESESENLLEAGDNIESMTLMTLSNKLI